jgi:hypothetical protein
VTLIVVATLVVLFIVVVLVLGSGQAHHDG